MSGFIGEVPKKITRGWMEILDKSNIIMEKTVEDISYVEIEAEEGSYIIIGDVELIRDPVTRITKEIHKYTYYNHGDNPESIYVRDILKSTYVKLDNGVEYTYPEYMDIGSSSPLDISHIYSEVRTERTEIHPHFGSKRAVIRKAWIGDNNGNPKEILNNLPGYKYCNLESILPLDMNSVSDNRTSYKVISYDNLIHIFTNYDHYIWNGSEWSNGATPLPPSNIISSFYEKGYIYYLNELHLFGYEYDGMNKSPHHYVYRNNEWIELTTPPIPMISGYVYNDKIYTFKTEQHVLDSGYDLELWVYDGNNKNRPYSYEKVYSISGGSSFTHYAIYLINNVFHIIISSQNNSYYNNYHLIYENDQWVEQHDTESWPSGQVLSFTRSRQLLDNKVYYVGAPDISSLDWSLVRTLTYIYDGVNWALSDLKLNTYACGDGYIRSTIYKNKIHLLGGETTTTRPQNSLVNLKRRHFSLNFEEYTQTNEKIVQPDPYKGGAIALYKNKIYLFNNFVRGNRYNERPDNQSFWSVARLYSSRNWRWDGEKWESADIKYEWPYTRSDMIDVHYNGKLVVWNGKLLYLTGFDDHAYYIDSYIGRYGVYAYNDSAYWENAFIYTSGGDKYPIPAPYTIDNTAVVVLNGKLQVLGGKSENSALRNHYQLNDSPNYVTNRWDSISTLPYDFEDGEAVVYNDEIHIFGGCPIIDNVEHHEYERCHYKWKDSTSGWVRLPDIPYDFYGGRAVVRKDKIHLLGSYKNPRYHYSWDGENYKEERNLVYDFANGGAIYCEEFDDEIHLYGGSLTMHDYDADIYNTVNEAMVTNFRGYFG